MGAYEVALGVNVCPPGDHNCMTELPWGMMPFLVWCGLHTKLIPACLPLQLARVLLQLRHYAACVSVTSKALEDARAVGDSLWAVQLQQVQANASAALGDAAAALMLMRDAFSRWSVGNAIRGPLGPPAVSCKGCHVCCICFQYLTCTYDMEPVNLYACFVGFDLWRCCSS